MGKGNKNKGKNKAETEPKTEPKKEETPWKAVTTAEHDQAAESISPAANKKYQTFIGKINNEGKDPKTAAEETGGMDHMILKNGKVPTHKVRLDGANRLTGYEGEEETDPVTGKKYRTFHVHQVSGHTK
jgi:hypothetical protein